MKNNSLLLASRWEKTDRALRFSSLVTKSHPWPVIGRTIFFTSDKNRPTNQKTAITHRDEIYFIDFWCENLSMYRIKYPAYFASLFHQKYWSLNYLKICEYSLWDEAIQVNSWDHWSEWGEVLSICWGKQELVRTCRGKTLRVKANESHVSRNEIPSLCNSRWRRWLCHGSWAERLQIIHHNESLGHLSNTHSAKNETN